MTTIKTTHSAKHALRGEELSQEALQHLDTNNDGKVTGKEVKDAFDINNDGHLSSIERELKKDFIKDNGIGVKGAEFNKVLEKLADLIGDGTISATGEVSVAGDVEINLNDLSDEALAKFLENLGGNFQKIGKFLDKATPDQIEDVKLFLKGQFSALKHSQANTCQDICGRSYADASSGLSQVTGWLSGGPDIAKMPPQVGDSYHHFFEGGIPVDPMAFVQWVLRESYLETTETLYDYAKKVQYFNEQKRAIRDHLGELRDFNTKWKEYGRNELGITDFDDMTPQQQADMQAYLSGSQSAGMNGGVYGVALGREVSDCLATAEDQLQKTFGNNVTIPEELKKTLTDALESEDPVQIKAALAEFAGFLAYLGDSGVKNGKYGTGGNDDVHHSWGKGSSNKGHQYDPDEAYDDYKNHYLDDTKNKQANSDLHTDDIAIIEAAFGIESGKMGISGGSSVEEVVKAAFKPVNDKWAHDIVDGLGKSSAEINEDLAKNGPNSEYAIAMYGSAEAAAEAYWGGEKYSAEEMALRQDLGMADGVPPPGCGSPEQLENEIKDWEDTLNQIGDDAQLANVDLQNWLQKQQQTMQMMSNISKMLHDTAMAIIRKIG
jgi:hypothetical protein